MTAWWGRFCLFVLVVLTAVRAYTVWAHGKVPLWVWLYGLQADLAALIVLAGVVTLGLFSRRRWLRASLAVLVVAVVLLVAGAELFYWHEFESRLDRLVFHYLAYPVEVFVFLDEQFYITWALLPFALLVSMVMAWLGFPPAAEKPSRLIVILLAAMAVLLLVRQPVLDSSRHLNQLASNGYVGVLTALAISQQDWSELYPGVTCQDSTGTASPGTDTATIRPIGRKNVVLIIEESFSGKTWIDPALRQEWLPEFSRLSGTGLTFTNIYAAGTRTTRGMESIMHGFPPLPGISATEREGVERLASLPRALKEAGYNTIFAYGGWPDFSNFTNYWHRIGFDHTTSRSDFPGGTFETSWGVEDKALFTHVLGLLDKMTRESRPVFLATLTVSNHRPFSLPPEAAQSDQRSLAIAMHYADSALGEFFRQARTRRWYEDTLFVVLADHGPRIQGDSLIPVESYRVPLLVISEPALRPAVITEMGSAIGVPATIVELLGIPTDEGFWGPSLLSGSATPVPVEHDYHVGELVNGQLTVLARGGLFYAWQQTTEGMAPRGTILPSTPEAVRVANYFGAAHKQFYAPVSSRAVPEH